MRARAVFMACKFGDEHNSRSRSGGDVESQSRSRQLFSEVLVAEDVDLGSRIHALGYKSVFLDEVLALGEVSKPCLLILVVQFDKYAMRCFSAKPIVKFDIHKPIVFCLT
jgi:hypothetical protein